MPPPPNAFATLADRYGAMGSTLAGYRDRPLDWVEDFVDFANGQGLTEYQREILIALAAKARVCVRSLHGVGKTTIVALAVLWFATTRDAAGIDWKCPTTAGAWRQLEKFLWPEIHKWAGRLRFEAMGRAPFTRKELLTLELKLGHGSAFAVASDDPAKIEGAHADSIFYVFDEAKSVTDATFDAAEGAFSGSGEALGLACSTPGASQGRFYDISNHKPGYQDWHTIHVTLPRALKAGLVSTAWAEKLKHQWGESSALYANRVLGEFYADEAEGIIALASVEAAVERRKVCNGDGGPVTRVGVDVARSGDDKTVIAVCRGHRVDSLRYSSHQDTMTTAGLVKGILDANPEAIAVIDADGLGAGVYDRLREQGYTVEPFHAGSKTKKRDRSGEQGFANVRVGAWWHLRELLEVPDSDVELPDDDVLLGDLTAPHWDVNSDSKILLEAKVKIKSRLGRSTDAADAVVMALWEDRHRRGTRITHVGPWWQ